MPTYTLTARLTNRTSTFTFTADDNTDAAFEAIKQVLDRAKADPTGPWSLGAIALRDSAGTVLHEMDAK